MQQSRRRFLQLTGATAAGLTLTGLSGHSLFSGEDKRKIKTFGLQLYTLRDVLPQDPKGILKQVASFGYKQIESYEGKDGMFWGLGHTGFKKYMDDLGMKMINSHCDMNKDFEKKAGDAAAIGMKYLICPWVGPQKKLDDFKKLADTFNQKGEICKKNGIRFAYHNHDYSFKAMDGQLPQDIMMTGTNPDTVDFEMDIYWVVVAGQDPIAWFKKYPNRFTSCHIKDRTKNPGTDNGKNSTDLGTGSIDFRRILKPASKSGMQYYIVEQEAYPNGTSLQAVQAGAEYMKKLKI
ncbi:MAG: TIM barrel protein [Bacteroidota bacterium]|nr:TIM barrel protein [Bacteroidota bacterium]